MSLYDRFELLGLDRDDGIKTFEAREIATGRPVKVHLFVQAGVPLQAALLKAIEHLPEEEAQRIIDSGKHEGTPYVVTDRLVDYPGLSEWVQATSHPSKPAKAPLETAGAWKVPPPSPALAATRVGPSKIDQPKLEQTRRDRPALDPANLDKTKFDKPRPAPSVNEQFADLFPTEERPVLPTTMVFPSPVSKPSAPAPATASRPPAPAAKEPGEFTRMFQSPVTASPEVAKPNIPAPPPPSPAAKEPGEFTRMFQSPVTASPAAPPPASQSPASSDFDRFFEPSSPAGPMPKNLQQPIAPQGNSGAGKVGEFTRMFGKPELGGAPAAPPAAPVGKGPGDFTRMFQGPGRKAATPAAPPPVAPPAPQMSAPPPPPVSFAAAPPPPAFAKQSGPGEYTRQFAAPSPLTLGQTAPVPSAPPPPAAAPMPAPPVAMPAASMPPITAPAAPAAPFGAAAAMPSAPAPAPPAKNNLPLIIGIAAIVLVAVVIVIVFALRPK